MGFPDFLSKASRRCWGGVLVALGGLPMAGCQTTEAPDRAWGETVQMELDREHELRESEMSEAWNQHLSR